MLGEAKGTFTHVFARPWSDILDWGRIQWSRYILYRKWIFFSKLFCSWFLWRKVPTYSNILGLRLPINLLFIGSAPYRVRENRLQCNDFSCKSLKQYCLIFRVTLDVFLARQFRKWQSNLYMDQSELKRLAGSDSKWD